MHRVFMYEHISTGKHAACKIIRYSKNTSHDDINLYQKEVKLHKALPKHENIISFLGHYEVPLHQEEESGMYAGMYMLLELGLGEELFDKIGQFLVHVIPVY